MKNCLALAIICVALSSNAAAEVRDSSATGFTVKTTLAIQATPQEAHRRLVRVGEWWGSDHTYSGSASNLSIEEKVGGCWCEKLPDGGALRHMEVIYMAPGKLVRMTGGLGAAGVGRSGHDDDRAHSSGRRNETGDDLRGGRVSPSRFERFCGPGGLGP